MRADGAGKISMAGKMRMINKTAMPNREFAMNDTLLSFDELKEMTGFKTAPRICGWLDANRISYLKSGRGRPLVSRAVLRVALGEMPVFGGILQTERSINFKKLADAVGR